MIAPFCWTMPGSHKTTVLPDGAKRALFSQKAELYAGGAERLRPQHGPPHSLLQKAA